jgi:regulator of nucleoside diphosphate kinase
MIYSIALPFRRFLDRMSHFFITGDSISLSRPLHLLSVFSRIEQLNQTTDAEPRARLGNLLLLEVRETQETCILELVAPSAAAPDKQRISVFSPLGSALLGMKCGDTCNLGFMGHNLGFTLIKVIR